ncbi:MAG: hypothetical protein EAZ42_02870 [Verrucomicrobia bacterium]|nr:MAG: hypothetical protein EAZ42_02870 [Verrucomicrobiota bacterium]
MKEHFIKLLELLEKRETIISDHNWRDRDSQSHLTALRGVSEEIDAWAHENQPIIDGKLRHYLANCSFQKALAHLKA